MVLLPNHPQFNLCAKTNWEVHVYCPMRNHFPGVIDFNHNRQKALYPRKSAPSAVKKLGIDTHFISKS
jgi:hypothetical protein